MNYIYLIINKENVHPDTARFILKGYHGYNNKFARKRWAERCCGRKVKQYTKDGKFIQEYPSIKAAAKAIGVTDSAIPCSIQRGGFCRGFKWQYSDQLNK